MIGKSDCPEIPAEVPEAPGNVQFFNCVNITLQIIKSLSINGHSVSICCEVSLEGRNSTGVGTCNEFPWAGAN